MASPKNFVSGFNHNVQHRGQGFHVQTEDSGAEIAMITTHLFLGGTILATRRDPYAELRGQAGLQDIVRARMQTQHKQMLRDLVGGAFDHKLQGITSYQPGEIVVKAEPEPPPPAPAPVRRATPPPFRPATTPGPAAALPPLMAVPAPPPPADARSPFCSSLVSDLTLDEVILAYLADTDVEAKE